MGVKLRCGCGQKVELEVTPESLPIQFVCPTCSADNSVVANQVLRQMFGIAEPATTPAPVAAAAPARLQLSPTASPAATATPAPAMRIQTQAQAASASAAPAIACAAEPAAAPTCPKHHHQPVMNYCVVCQKPMCGKCMEVFGYVCSAFCRGKAEAQKIDVPVYLNQRTVSEAHFGRKVMRSSLAIAGGLALVAAVWVWWAWFATVPKPEYSVAFAESSPSGHARLGALNQLIVLHGDTLARYDLKAKREIWSKKVLDKELIASAAGPALAQMQKSREAAIANGASPFDIILPSMKDIQDDLVRSAEASLQLQMQRENVWLRFPEKLVRYDWNSGAAVQEIAMTDYFGYFTRKDGELVSIIDSEAGGKMITRIDLTSGELKKEQITAGPSTDSSLANARPGAAKTIAGATVLKTAAGAPKFTSNQLAMAARLMTNSALMAGLARNGKKPLDPQAVAKQYQNLPLSAKLAVPAVVAANANQQRLMDELDSDMEPAMNGALAAALKGMDNTDRVSIIPAAEGFAEFSVKLLEQKTVERKVMKAPPKKSALDGNVTAGNSMSAANEVLNEMQRDLVGDTVMEDVSLYQVSLRQYGKNGKAWTGEANGSPQFIPLKTINILAAADTITVFDSGLEKLWEGKLSSGILGGGFGGEESESGTSGPCVERGDRIYISDQTMITVFEKRTGKVLWRLPSIGTSSLLFDGAGFIYVNTTTGSPDSVKYSRQIDVTQKIRNQVIKLEEASGKLLWRVDGAGLVNYVSGKFIYTAESDNGPGNSFGIRTGLEIPAHVRIRRLSPSNGRILWEHYQKRAPLDIQFEENRIELLFKNELQVLKYMTL